MGCGLKLKGMGREDSETRLAMGCGLKLKGMGREETETSISGLLGQEVFECNAC